LQSSRWEDRLGAFIGLHLLITAPPLAREYHVTTTESACRRYLEDEEARVRLALAEVAGALAARHGTRVAEALLPIVIASITAHFARDDEAAEPSSALPGGASRSNPNQKPNPNPIDAGDSRPLGPAHESEQGSHLGEPSPLSHLSTPTSTPHPRSTAPSIDPIEDLLGAVYAPPVPGRGEMRHGTEGWKCLETSFKVLQRLMESTGLAFAPYLSDEVWSLITRGLRHPNRFVRETGFFATGAMVETLDMTGDMGRQHGVEVAHAVAGGLSDNWSQVRFAASTAARRFMLAAPEDVRAQIDHVVIPAMCLNRYYVAEGVRLYAQESWRLVVGDQGVSLVTRHVDAVVAHYVEQSKANNHAVREAACACIAELMTKIKSKVRRFEEEDPAEEDQE
jgi:hypothetical protein